MASSQAVRFVAPSAKSVFGAIYLQCHVKPGASKQREGILALSDNVVDLCVAPQAREGEANKAVRDLLSEVQMLYDNGFRNFWNANIMTQILKVAKTDVQVIKGHKSRDKIVAVTGIDLKGDGQACIERIKQQLQESAES